MKTIRHFRTPVGGFMVVLLAVWQIAAPLNLSAATVTWTAGSTTDLLWNTSSNWSSAAAPISTDDLIFATPIPNPGALLNPQIITLGASSVANSLSFKNNYTLTGGELTLSAGGAIRTDLGMTATIGSQLLGTAGLTKTGGGAVRLTNVTNSYTGTTSISNGSLIIGDAAALGADTSAIVVTGSATRGFGGGSLVLEGGYTSGVLLTRGLSLQGLGPITDRNAALVSVRSNEVSGAVTTNSGLVNTAIHSASGRLTLSGGFDVGGTAGTTLAILGMVNSTGVGSYAITGPLTGTGTLQKTGAGTLLLTPSVATGFSGRLRVTAGTVRIDSAAVLGTANGTTTSAPIDLDGGILEVRAGVTDGATTAFGKNVYVRNGSTMFFDHAVSSSAINGVNTFGTVTYEDGETQTFSSRNGYGVTFSTLPVSGGNGDSNFTNSLLGGGVLTFTGAVWSNTDTGNRSLTIAGNGNTTLSSNIIASGGSHSLVKSGTGTLTIGGTASTYTGNTTVTGTLSVGNLGGINKNSTTGSIQLSTGTLTYTGAVDTLAKPFSLIAATASNAVLANGSGTLTLTGNVGAGGAGAKTFFLGGTNSGDNTFSSLLIDNSSTNTTGLSKIGTGTWVLKEPAGAAYGSVGSVTISNPGSTATNTITLSSGTTAGLLVGQVLAGTTASTPPQITGIIDATHFTVGVNLTTTTAPAGTYTVNAIPTASTATAGGIWSGPLTIAGGTVKLVATNATSNIVQNTNPIVFNVDALNANQVAGGTLEFVGVNGSATTETLGALTPTIGAGTVKLTTGGGGAAANLVFGSLGTVGNGSGVNFNTTGGGGGTVNLTGVADTTATTLPGNGHLYFNGSNFAVASGGTGLMGAPTYVGAGAVFTTAGAGTATLTASKHNEVTGAITAQTALTVTSLKLTTSSLAMSAAGTTLTVNTGGAANDGGILQTGGSASISQGIITTGGAGAVVIRVDGASDVLTLGANIGSTTAGGLTKNGAGKLIISGVNAQAGNTTINEGTVQLSGSGRLSATSRPTIIRQGAILDLNGLSSGVAIAALDGAGTIRNTSATPATLIVGNITTGAGTFSGLIEDFTGVLNVTKTGTSGSPTWSGANTYTGVTTIGVSGIITTGLVNIPILANYGTASGIGKGIQTTVSDANNTASLVFGGTSAAGINYTGLTSVSIDRLFTMNSSVAGAGAQIANASANNSALILNKTNAITFGAGATVAQTLTLGGASTADNLINHQINDNSALRTSLSKIGVGTWFLGGVANGYTGSTTITAGVLGASSGTTLPTNSPLVIAGGQLLTSGNFVRNLVATATPGNANEVTWTAGGGFAASDAKLVVAIGGLATPSSLTWASGGFVTSGALILNSANALSEVEVRNPIDLNGATRTIQVDDNGNTQTDFATITGVISNGTGTGNLSKTGTGTLQLFGANTYNGATAVTGGTLAVTSLGLSTNGAGSTSVGQQSGANTATSAITLGNGTTTRGILQYIGTGETSDRMIRLNTTTGTGSDNHIHADGSGALILSNVLNDMTAGAKTLVLRGSNTAGNMITNILTDNGGNLSVTVDGGATWILSAANTYSGNTAANAGALGIGNNSALGSTGSLTMSNSSVFAYGADRTVANNLSHGNNTVQAFIGDYSLNFTGTYANQSSANSNTITNTIVSGKTLTLNNITNDAITAGRTITFNGSGDTIVSGNITTSTAFNLGITYSGTGSLTLTGTSPALNAGNVTVSSGTLKLGASGVIPDGATAGNVAISPAAAATATFNLNGFSETINGLTATSAGTTVIDNTSGSASTLTFGANNQAVAFGAATGTFTITDSGAGALSITKTGTAAATISDSTLTYQGSTNVTGGMMTISSALNGTTGLSVSNASSVLSLTGGITVPTAITTVSVGNGGTLNLLDGTGNKLSALTSLTLGTTAGTNTTLGLNVGDVTAGDGVNTDTFTLTALGTLTLFTGNSITFNLTDTGLNPNTDYILLDASAIGGGFLTGPLTIGNYILGATPGGFTSIDLTTSSTNNQIIMRTGNLITGKSYYTGLTSTAWNGASNNWSVDDLLTIGTDEGKLGTLAAASVPGQGTDVVFVADNITGGTPITTTLEQNFKINSLTFEASTTPANTPTAVTIDPGTITTNRLEVAPQVSTDGIRITAGGSPSVTIAAPLKLGAAQTWNVADVAATLTLSGGIQGEFDVTKTGSGRVLITAAAPNTFNPGVTTDVTVSAGVLELTNAGALGSVADANVARIAVNGGAFYYNNGTAGTLPNNLTLGGGTLSAAGNSQTYSGTVAVSAASAINLRDSNSAVTTTASRSITLSGLMSGSGKITLDSIDTVASGNQEAGTLTISNNSNSWSGDLAFTRGTVVVTSTAGYGGDVLFNQFGRLITRNTDGNTLNRAGTIDFAASAVGEFSVDNTGALASNYTVNQTGAVNLGSGSIARFNLADVASTLNLTGGVVLGGNASITVEGGDADSLVTISTTGISGTGNLAINDEAGTWAVTSTRLAINAAGSYVGNTTINEGTLILGHKNALSSGSLTITGASTLQSSVDLASGGVGPVPNALTLNAGLTVSGTNNITLSGLATGTGNDADRTLTSSITGPAALVLSGGINIGAAANTAARTLTIAGTGLTSVTSAIVDGSAFANNLTVTNSNITTLTGTNTYTGTTTMNAAAGTLLFQGSNTGAGGTTLTTGKLQFDSATNGGIATGALFLTAGSMEAVNAARSLSNATTFGGNFGVVGSQNLTLAGTSTQNGSRTVTNTMTAGTFRISTFNLAEATSARTLTVSGTGATVIGTLTNNAANNVLTSTVTGGGSLTVDTNIFLSEITGTGRTLTINGAGDTAVSGIIANFSGGAGTAGIVSKAGAGTLTLTGANTYTGGTIINLGTIRSGAGNVLPNTGTITVNATAAGTALLDLNGNSDTIAALTFGGTSGNVAGVNQVTTGAGTLTLGGTVTVTATGNWTSPALLSGNVALGAARTFSVANSTGTDVDFDVQAIISGATFAITKTGAGTLLLSGANSYSGGTTINTGEVRSGAANVLPNTGTITVNNTTGASALLNLNGFSDTIAALTLGGTSGVAGSVNQVTTGAGTLTLGGTVTVTATGNWTNPALISGNLSVGTATRTFAIADSTGTAVDLDVQAVISSVGAFGITKTGLGTLLLSAANTYTGTTTINNGIVRYGVNDAIPSTSAVTVNGNGAGLIGTLDLNGFNGTIASLTLGGTSQTATSASIVQTGAGTLTLGGDVTTNATGNPTTTPLITGNLDLGASTRTFTIADSTGSLVDLDVQAVVSGTVGLTKTGVGALLLSNTNTYSGKTTIASGPLAISVVDSVATANQSLGTHTDLDLGVAGTSSGTLVYTGAAGTLAKNINALGNGTDTIQNLGSGLLTLSGTITKNGTTLYSLGGGSGILITGTVVGGAASSDLVISGGTTTLANANTYNGPTFLEATGTLNINNASAISTGAFNINGGVIDNTSGSAITLSTNNALNINADFTFTGTNNLNLGTGAVTLNANRVVTLTAGTLTVGGSIGGAFNLTGTGAGTLLLTGSSTYSGNTAIQGGSTFEITSNGGLGSAAGSTTVDSGSSLLLNNVNYTNAEPLFINGAGVGGNGALRSTGTSSFAGPITASTHATINAGGGTFTLTGGLVKDGTTLTLYGGPSGGSFNINTVGISGASANSDLVIDNASVALNVANTYNGPTYIRNGGIINANVASALPTSPGLTDLTMDDTGAGSSNLTLGASQSVASLTGAATSTINLSSSTLTVGKSSGSTTFTGIISGSGGLVKDNASTQVLSGASTYSGGTSVTGGTLEVNNTSGSGTGSGSVTISSTSTLSGDGAISTDVSNAIIINGTLQIGATGATQGTDFSLSAGTGASTILGAASFTKLDLWSTTGTDQSGNLAAADMVRLFGDFDINSGATLMLSNPNSLAFQAGDILKLFDWTGLGLRTGTWTTIDSTSLNLGVLGLTLNTSNLYVTSGALAGTISITAVPEPGRLLFLFMGLLALLSRRRRQSICSFI